MPFSFQNVGQLTVRGRAQGQQILNVFHWRYIAPDGGPIPDVDIDAAVNDFSQRWRDLIAATFASSYVVEVYNWRTLTGVIDNPTPPPPTMFTEDYQTNQIGGALDVGGLATAALPTFAASGWQKLTDRAGRNYRGSARLGPHVEVDTDNNSWTVPFIGTITPLVVSVFTTPLSTISGPTFEMCVFSRTLALGAITPFSLLRDLTAKVTGVKLNGFVSSQVSRKQSLGSPT